MRRRNKLLIPWNGPSVKEISPGQPRQLVSDIKTFIMEQILLSRPASKPAPSVKASEKASGRLLYIDNLRWVMIMLVVSMHAAVTYIHLGSWYYMDDTPVTLPGQAIFAPHPPLL